MRTSQPSRWQDFTKSATLREPLRLPTLQLIQLSISSQLPVSRPVGIVRYPSDVLFSCSRGRALEGVGLASAGRDATPGLPDVKGVVAILHYQVDPPIFQLPPQLSSALEKARTYSILRPAINSAEFSALAFTRALEQPHIVSRVEPRTVLDGSQGVGERSTCYQAMLV